MFKLNLKEMTNITAKEINELRQRTGAGMMDCRKALLESNGDFEQAIDLLRKKGQKVAALRGGREAKEGVVLTGVNGERAVLLRLSCETDFVAKNDGFIEFAREILQVALSSSVLNLEELKQKTFASGATIADGINEQVAKIGEKIDLSDFEVLTGSALVDYVHGNYRIGTIVAFNKKISEEVGKDIAMQIAAMSPLSVDASSMPKALVEREEAVQKEILLADEKMKGKSEDMLAKILEGKLKAFFKERTLLDQSFIKDGSKTVRDYLKSVDSELQVVAFKRVSL